MSKQTKENTLFKYMFKKRKETDTPDSDIDSSITDNQCLPVPDTD